MLTSYSLILMGNTGTLLLTGEKAAMKLLIDQHYARELHNNG